MTDWRAYRGYFFAACLLHFLLGVSVLWEYNTDAVAIQKDSGHASIAQPDSPVVSENQAILAHSIDASAVTDAVEQLKSQRLHAAEAEKKHQQQLLAQAHAAQQRRELEQRRIDALKAEAAQLVAAEKKRLQQEQQRLSELTRQKELEKQKLIALQAEQQQLRERELAHQREINAQKIKAELALKAKQEAALAAAAANRARMAGIIDQYKARIIHAISQQWILPQNADSRLSSQFRIRLGPDGQVLEVSLIRSSGDPLLDRSAQSAIYKASPLPIPHDAELFQVFRDISLTVRPENVQG